MWNPDTELTLLEADLSSAWSQAQRLEWHSTAWNDQMAMIARIDRNVGRLIQLNAQAERIRLSA